MNLTKTPSHFVDHLFTFYFFLTDDFLEMDLCEKLPSIFCPVRQILSFISFII